MNENMDSGTQTNQVNISNTPYPAVIIGNVAKGAVVHFNSAGDSYSALSNESASIHAISLKKQLKGKWKNLVLPVVPWMDVGKTLPLDAYYIPLQMVGRLLQPVLKCSGLKTNAENIFDGGPRRILIESQPGYGKSTLMRKIFTDLLAKKTYLRQFKFGILLYGKYVRGQTLKSLAVHIRKNIKQNNPTDELKHAIMVGNDEEIWKLVNNEKTLILLDGLDDVSECDRKSILKTLYDTESTKVTIVTSSKSGSLSLSDDEKTYLFGDTATFRKFWDKKFDIDKNWEKTIEDDDEIDSQKVILIYEENGNVTQTSGGVPLSVINSLNTNIDLERVFDGIFGFVPTRILIESQPGFGKTTLVYKIIHDWVVEKDYVQRFEFAFLIILKNKKADKSLRDVIMENTGANSNDESMWTLINTDSTLLLLDGLDEVDESDRINILKVLYDESLYKMTIVVTCRTWLFELCNEERNILFEGLSKGVKFWHRKIKILGLTGNNRKRFVEKFAGRSDSEQIVKKVQETIPAVTEIFKSPLLLLLLIFIITDNSKFQYRTKTDLYNSLVDCIIKRSITRENTSFTEEQIQGFTIFGEKKENKDLGYYKRFCEFGRLAVDHIVNDNLQFDCDSNTNQVYEMGFFIKHKTEDVVRCYSHYESFHLTILEFAAAVAMRNDFIENRKKFSPEIVRKINTINLKKGFTSMILPFLSGLMGKDVVMLFKQLSDFCAFYSFDFAVVDSILAECELSDELYTQIARFIPPVYCYRRHCPMVMTTEDLIQHVVSLDVNSSDLLILGKSCAQVDISNLAVYITVNPPIATEDVKIFCQNRNIKCQNLFVTLTENNYIYENLTAHFKMTLYGIKNECKHLYIGEDVDLNLIQNCIQDEIFCNQKIGYLRFHLNPKNIAIDTIINIFQKNEVKQLVLEIKYDINLERFDEVLSVVVPSQNLSSLLIRNFTNKSLKLDLSKITFNGKKCWDYFGVTYIALECSEPLTNYECIKSFQTYESTGCNSCVESLHALKPRELRCGSKFLNSISLDKPESVRKPNLSLWGGYTSIVDLILVLGGNLGHIEILSYLTKFTNLKSIQICVLGDLNGKQLEIVASVKSLSLNSLQFRWQQTNSSELIDIIKGIGGLVSAKQLKSIKNIDFELIDNDNAVEENLTILSTLMDTLKCDSKLTAHFISQYSSQYSEKFLKIFNTFDSSEFKIEQVTKEVATPYVINEFQCDFLMPFLRILKIRKKKLEDKIALIGFVRAIWNRR